MALKLNELNKIKKLKIVTGKIKKNRNLGVNKSKSISKEK